MNANFNRGLSVLVIAGLAGLTACEREPAPSDIAPTNPPTPGEAPAPRPNELPETKQPPPPIVRPPEQQPVPAPAPKEDLAPTPKPGPPPAKPEDPARPASNPGGAGQLPAGVADTMNRYLMDVEEATSLLRQAQDASSAATVNTRLADLGERITSTAGTLEALPEPQQQRLRERHRATLTGAVGDFRVQAERISAANDVSDALKNTVEDITLFE